MIWGGLAITALIVFAWNLGYESGVREERQRNERMRKGELA